ncbi:hypothetical protein F6R97_05750 [Pseudomonas sp. JV414]|nr:hypothetical protein [Pseudomonas sp. JV414]
MGAGLLAKTAAHPALLSPDTPLSRASPLPHGLRLTDWHWARGRQYNIASRPFFRSFCEPDGLFPITRSSPPPPSRAFRVFNGCRIPSHRSPLHTHRETGHENRRHWRYRADRQTPLQKPARPGT